MRFLSKAKRETPDMSHMTRRRRKRWFVDIKNRRLDPGVHSGSQKGSALACCLNNFIIIALNN